MDDMSITLKQSDGSNVLLQQKMFKEKHLFSAQPKLPIMYHILPKPKLSRMYHILSNPGLQWVYDILWNKELSDIDSVLNYHLLRAEKQNDFCLDVKLLQLLSDGGFKILEEHKQILYHGEFITSKKETPTEAKDECQDESLLSDVQSDHSKHVDILDIAKAYIKKKNDFDKTPLHLSALIGDTELVHICLKAGANVDANDLCKLTALHCSAWCGHKDVAEILLTAGASVDAEDCSKKTPLYMSAERGHKEIVEILLKAGASVDAEDLSKKTPLHLSAERGHKEVVEILLKVGADVDVNWKQTPLHFSAENGHKDVVEILLKAGASVDAEDCSKKTPLHLSAERGHKEIVEILLKAGADVKNSHTQSEGWFQKVYPASREQLATFSQKRVFPTGNFHTETTCNRELIFQEKMRKSADSSLYREEASEGSSGFLAYKSLNSEQEVESSNPGSSCAPLVSAKPCGLGSDDRKYLDQIKQQVLDHWTKFSPEYAYNVECASSTGRIVMPTTFNIITKKNTFYNIPTDAQLCSSVVSVPVSGHVVVEQKKIPPENDEDNDDSLTDDSSEASTQSHDLDVMENLKEKIKKHWATFSSEEGEDREMSLRNEDTDFHNGKLIIPTTVNITTTKKKVYYMSSNTQLNHRDIDIRPSNCRVIVDQNKFTLDNDEDNDSLSDDSSEGSPTRTEETSCHSC
jgi:ankyrin repeat protein